MALIGAALGHVDPGGAIVGISAVTADYPTAGIAHYSAAKAALSAYLKAVRHERRRDGIHVIDVRPPHLDTGFSDRALAGTPPRLPEPVDHQQVVAATIEALRAGRREVTWDLGSRQLAVA
jgi:short-subunit dehydrogenase